MEKYFIVTVDTEPDGQWDVKASETTKNSKYIDRFQRLCNEYGFKPVYLTNYSMLKDDFFVAGMRHYLKKNECEIGMHLHAWDTPPICDFDKKEGNRPYLIEYSDELMEQKIATITKRLSDVFERDMVSHRAGRWALDERYIQYLDKYGYQVDCSVTPHINWSKTKGKGKMSKGSNYSKCQESPYFLSGSGIFEVPMTVRKVDRQTAIRNCNGSAKQYLKNIVLGDMYWYRPALFSEKQMQALYEQTRGEAYLEMMLHSSELMPGGSPYFPSEESIEEMYKTLEALFHKIAATHKGATLADFSKKYLQKG